MDKGEKNGEAIVKIKNEDKIQLGDDEFQKDTVVLVLKIIISIIYFIQALFFIIEGILISRAILKGKTTLIIVFLLLGFILPLLTLIHAATISTYTIDSASNLVSLVIKTVILRQVFEIRRLKMDT